MSNPSEGREERYGAGTGAYPLPEGYGAIPGAYGEFKTFRWRQERRALAAISPGPCVAGMPRLGAPMMMPYVAGGCFPA
jgi:hypothetical protein